MTQNGNAPARQIDAHSLSTQSFEWGAIKWFVTPERIDGAELSFGEVILLPGKGHDRHNHPESEEVLYVLSGEGMQMLDDGEPFHVGPGAVIYVPTAVYHSTLNTGWEPMRLLAIYNPGGPEKLLQTLPGYHEIPAGTPPPWSRS